MGLFDDWSVDYDAGPSTIDVGPSPTSYDDSGLGLWAQNGDYQYQPSYDFGGDSNATLSSLLGGGGGGLTLGGGGGYNVSPAEGGILAATNPYTNAPTAGENLGNSADGKSYADVAGKTVTAGSGGGKSITEKLGDTLLKDKNGDIDLSKVMKLVTGIGGIYSALKNQPQKAQTTQQLQQQLVQKNNDWTPQQSIWANKYFQTPINQGRGVAIAGGAGMPSSILPSRGYAGGGGIGAPGDGRYGAPAAIDPRMDPRLLRAKQDIFARALQQRAAAAGEGEAPPVVLQKGNYTSESVNPVSLLTALKLVPGLIRGAIEDKAADYTDKASGGPLGLIDGEGDGQSDSVPINAAKGEYVMDAETVSMLGNGSNEAGAALLDKWREHLREHKRSVGSSEIAPPTKDPNEYLEGEK